MDRPYYFVADAYYANGKTVKGLLKKGNHLVARAKSNSVAYEKPGKRKPKSRGRSKTYGKKVKLKLLFKKQNQYEEIESPVYGEKEVMLKFKVYDLLWKPAGTLVRFVLVDHPTRGQFILMSTDLSLSAEQIIYLYGLRFKIEHIFKQSVRMVGVFSYHFWMKEMKPLRRNNGNQYLL